MQRRARVAYPEISLALHYSADYFVKLVGDLKDFKYHVTRCGSYRDAMPMYDSDVSKNFELFSKACDPFKEGLGTCSIFVADWLPISHSYCRFKLFNSTV